MTRNKNKLPLDALIDYNNSFYDDWTSCNYRYVVPSLCCQLGNGHSFKIYRAEYAFLHIFTYLADTFL